ncbi:hypothetical protein CHU95_19945 [Niveispirillum lacus]|uniref:Uncharacterized protein n=1 Tax=Niveispirillum lacus TaxID=1981099 RepID=A0A255YQB1_9PROT|nr:hypothetical protein [Niveispirillum lacus]OYQ31426.1 hypothetical protein CHU95_19945 [Niveispirillum lacus]
MTTRIWAAILATFTMLALAGCSSQPPPRETIRTMEVAVPVPVSVAPPAELLAAIQPPATDVFLPPGAPGAVACIDAAGRAALVGYVDQLRNAVSAWQAWAGAQAD